jgi:maltose alpha-D-glucosyltransferase/alpha-amylase
LHRAFVAQSATLGRRIGELHAAFATTTGNPAFDPERVTPADLGAWQAAVRDDVGRTLDQLERRSGSLPDAVMPAARALLASRERLLALVDAEAIDVAGLVKTRYHGDLHLGQVLVVRNDFVIIDFEGEPGRSVEERRRKHSPLRDVAGMIRSADYAARTALSRFAAGRTDAAALVGEVLRDWRLAVTGAFLAAYREATRALESVPHDDGAMERLVRLFTLEKALYEVRYELDNRPDWLYVPVAALLELGGAETAATETAVAESDAAG